MAKLHTYGTQTKVFEVVKKASLRLEVRDDISFHGKSESVQGRGIQGES